MQLWKQASQRNKNVTILLSNPTQFFRFRTFFEKGSNFLFHHFNHSVYNFHANMMHKYMKFCILIINKQIIYKLPILLKEPEPNFIGLGTFFEKESNVHFHNFNHSVNISIVT